MRLWIGFAFAALVLGQRRDPLEYFETRVRPVLAKNCFSCHTQTKLGGLEMVSRDSLLKGGKSGPAIDIERPEESLLVKAVRHTDDKLKMPPNGKLSDGEIKDLVNWIGRGAAWPAATVKGHGYKITPEQRSWWAFQPVRKPVPPAVKDKAWARTPIDQFLLASLESRGLKPVRPASKREWIRRVSYDLTGLPPKAEDVDAFLLDNTADAKARVVDRLLASSQYGERWGRYWLDVARYSDDLLNSTQDQPYDNAFRYRDWVIQAFNDDMPYDVFVKAQLAGDMLKDKEKTVAGLGFYALSPQFQDDRVDVTTKAFLGLTVACAQCHDHKFDPIPTKDYYSLLGVFTSTAEGEFPLAGKNVVEEYKARKAAVEDQEKKLNKYLDDQAKQLSEVMAYRTADYIRAVRKVVAGKAGIQETAKAEKLDEGTLQRWHDYLQMPAREHSFLEGWQTFDADAFQQKLLATLQEQKNVEEKNFIRLGGSSVRSDLAGADLLSLPREKWLLWRDTFSSQRFGKFDSGILYYKTGQIDRFLTGAWKAHLDQLRTDVDTLKKAVPERYPYYHIITDREKVKNERVRIRGAMDNLGEEAPRGFVSILSEGEPRKFTNGSGRLELAEAIADAKNPLATRVAANRMWHYLFGAGLVRTLNNFGQLGEKPSHPELLDYLAARLVEQKWSFKAMIRELTLSSAYGLSYLNDAKNFTADPDNRLLWRATRRKLDIESLRDSLLAASGEIDVKMGGAPMKLSEEKNLRRTVYGFVSRRKLDGTLALFDFPNPNSMSEQRIPTSTPVQQLYYLNSKFLMDRAGALSTRLSVPGGDASRIKQAYRVLFYREPEKAELESGLAFLKSNPKAWPQYAQVLLSSNEFLFY
ncbi:MAG TPA: PSD1 and planctomycete cytochrome C domain-containing protein [Bryobacteraceae bacterium]|nr:PSD1 and planctomycete cytochrome C domain-containing protein [Bryobacteraceae bacterium]